MANAVLLFRDFFYSPFFYCHHVTKCHCHHDNKKLVPPTPQKQPNLSVPLLGEFVKACYHSCIRTGADKIKKKKIKRQEMTQM